MQNSERKLLVLDLDETLIYATERNLERDFDFVVGPYFVYKRPYLDEFLKFCFENFEIAVWTSSTAIYAAEIIENIFDYKDVLSFIWSRERCTVSFDEEERVNFHEKKILKIKRRGYDLQSVIVVDDSPEKWRSSYGNLVRVQPFFGEIEDDELKHLIVYLGRLNKIENIRKFEKRNWRGRL